MKNFGDQKGSKSANYERMGGLRVASVGTGVYSAGLRSYMSRVFAYFLAGLAICFGIAVFVPTCSWYMPFMQTSGIGLTVAWFVISIGFNFAFPRLSFSTALGWFLVDVALLGVVLSPISIWYAPMSLVTTFFVTTSMFLSLVMYGYVTKKDLTGFGPIIFMGLVGIILAGFINIFTKSSAFSLAISAVGIVVISAYIAYTMQLIKGLYSETDSREVYGKKVIFGASMIFHEFINLFLHILRFLGRR